MFWLCATLLNNSWNCFESSATVGGGREGAGERDSSGDEEELCSDERSCVVSSNSSIVSSGASEGSVAISVGGCICFLLDV